MIPAEALDRVTEIQPQNMKRPSNEAIAELLELAKSMLADERARGAGLETKAATLAGFTGAILALTAAQGRELAKLDLGRIGDPTFHGLFIFSVLGLVVAAGVYLIGVLRPQAHLAIKPEELKKQITSLPGLTEAAEIQGRLLSTLSDPHGSSGVLDCERALNDRKATLMQIAGFALIIGLLGVAGQALVLGLHEAGL